MPMLGGTCHNPTVIDPEDPPPRPERHIPNSTATNAPTSDRRSHQKPAADAMLQHSNRNTARPRNL